MAPAHPLTVFQRIRKRGALLIIPGKAPAGGLQLRETLFANGFDRVSGTDVISATVLELVSNTAAGTHDSSDATFDQLLCENDGFDLGDGSLSVLYTFQASAYGGAISFVRLVCRARLNPASTTPGLSSLQGANGTALPSNPHGDPISPFTDTSYADRVFDAPLAPDAGPWTAAKINALMFGFTAYMQCAPVASDLNSAFIDVSEIRLEVWG